MATIRGKIKLKADTEMWNRQNHGKYPWEFIQPAKIIVPQNTEVDCERLETSSGLYYTVTYRNEHGTFEASKKVNDTNYNKKEPNGRQIPHSD